MYHKSKQTFEQTRDEMLDTSFLRREQRGGKGEEKKGIPRANRPTHARVL